MPNVKDLRAEVLKHKKGDKPVSKMTKHELLSYIEKYNPSYLAKPPTAPEPTRGAKVAEKVKMKMSAKKETYHSESEEEVVVKPKRTARIVEEENEFVPRARSRTVVEPEEAPRRRSTKQDLIREILF